MSQPEHIDEGIGESIRAESVQPFSRAESVHPYSTEETEPGEATDSDYEPGVKTASPSKRRRRRASQSSVASTSKVNKRSPTTRRQSSNSSVVKRKSPKKAVSPTLDTPRHFPCPLAGYKCGSTFTSKNEWKRHVSTQHVRLGFWRCDLCPRSSTPSDISTTSPAVPNDFNRKDLFTQHLRRMHSNLKPPPSSKGSIVATTSASQQEFEHQKRCYMTIRQNPPRSGCLFCAQKFAGENSWEERMEHVGAHLEARRKGGEAGKKGEKGEKVDGDGDVRTWNEDKVLHDWLVEEGLVERDGKGGWRVGVGGGLPLNRTIG
ncbi:hypothetical protein K402DRAFT_333188 [Aulographum hederae CBS 113979]|uniref:C2H2-type domain-containing protein n=1 Tax=Aulographum hederae CBS 113979 TaxID=1176131 RepID=A0A6G1GZG6_9PEZI|nr:hypothetical protein K402DRAFT_333188 [Aulographum hederae CBS 113979]